MEVARLTNDTMAVVAEVSQCQTPSPQLIADASLPLSLRWQLKSSADNCRHNSLLQDNRAGRPYR